MAKIKRVEHKYQKPNTIKDSKSGKWVGFQVDVRATNGKRLRPTFPTETAAERFIEELKLNSLRQKAGLAPVRSHKVTLRQLFDARLPNVGTDKGRVLTARVFGDFIAIFDAPPLVGEVRKPHFLKYINVRRKAGVADATIDREVNEIRSAFREAEAMFPEELEDFVPPTIPRIKLPPSHKEKHEITRDEMDAIATQILNVHSPHSTVTESLPVISRIFRIGWLLGLRFSEITRLVRRDVNTKARTLNVWRSKNKRYEVIKFLPDEAIDVLLDCEGDKLFNLKCSDHTFETVIKAACEAAGVLYGRNVNGGITFHSTRHAFTSRIVRVTDLKTAQSYTGNSEKVLLKYYAMTSAEEQKKAMDRMYKPKKSLREIFDEVRAGKLDFESFEALF